MRGFCFPHDLLVRPRYRTALSNSVVCQPERMGHVFLRTSTATIQLDCYRFSQSDLSKIETEST
jgi:hypothetical protein